MSVLGQLPCEVLATIHLPEGRRINIDRALDSILDALAVEGSVEHVNAGVRHPPQNSLRT